MPKLKQDSVQTSALLDRVGQGDRQALTSLSPSHCRPRGGRRRRARTVKPCSRSVQTRLTPRKPPAPVTNTGPRRIAISPSIACFPLPASQRSRPARGGRARLWGGDRLAPEAGGRLPRRSPAPPGSGSDLRPALVQQGFGFALAGVAGWLRFRTALANRQTIDDAAQRADVSELFHRHVQRLAAVGIGQPT